MDVNLLVILNDNEMSISPNVGALPKYLASNVVRDMRGVLSTIKAQSSKVLDKLPGAMELVQNLARLRLDCAQHAAHIAHDVAGEVFRQRADVGGNRHFVVVEDNQQVHVHIARAVQDFKRLTRRHRTVADNGDTAAVAAQEFVCRRHAQRRADGGRGMTHAESVVFGFAALGETRQAAVAAHDVHLVFATGEDFVRIALMTDVPN